MQSISEPRNRRLVATVFRGDGSRISCDDMLIAPALFGTGLAAGCASEAAYAEELRRGQPGEAARRGAH